MSACSLSVNFIGQVPPAKGSMQVVSGDLPVELVGVVTLPTSYDSNGSTLDLSNYFSAIPKVILNTANGKAYQYVEGTTPANGLVKGFKAEGTEEDAKTDLSSQTLTIIAIGAGK